MTTASGDSMTRSDGDSVAAAVLVGGSSRRMGTPKAMLRVPEHGPSMLERVVRVLRLCAGQVMLVGTPESKYPLEVADLPCVVDAGAGPVGGLIAALRASNHPSVLLVACDLPFLSEEVARLMIARAVMLRRGVCPRIGTVNGPQTLQPLVAVYRRDDVEEIVSLFNAGERSLVGIVTALQMAMAPVEDILAIDAELWSFFNVNTPEDLDVARRHALLCERNDDDTLA